MTEKAESNLNTEILDSALSTLQNKMAVIDMMTRRADPDVIEFLVLKYQDIAIRMDANPNHYRAHIHIDYGHKRHMASYAIDDGKRLAGSPKYDRVLTPWTLKHQDVLLRLWKVTRNSPQPEALLAEIREASSK